MRHVHQPPPPGNFPAEKLLALKEGDHEPLGLFLQKAAFLQENGECLKILSNRTISGGPKTFQRGTNY